ncbi:hypothetical protein [Saccharospirillum salsuginis]|uniref:Uncharacterized protein n=1 Tax=Saccharospirillum salsuginis TaxID=418750 RepID=A0A918JYS8_9GAMM|nr:hypothetical protein [Saccharospirillum salsuginis]GGX38711.1 hypothetical protein GCM10007392_01150 [Saccharospirillum salsuginis]
MHSKAALAIWVLAFAASLFPLGWSLILYNQVIPQFLMVNTISLWMVLSHSLVYRHLKRWRLQFLPEVFRLILFVILGYLLVNWFL